jgi:DNA polymerase I-like protein with 3'-5' exonuclease and polymerase domains
MRRYMVKGRIHCSFRQIAAETEGGDQKGARYGRLSATDPNVQQQPARDEFAKRWRSIYVPDEGRLWGSMDYSQQEPRWTTHFAAVSPIRSRSIAQETAQAYHDNPDLDNHQFMAELTGLPRKFAKNIYLGVCYGEGGPKLCSEIGQPTRWAIMQFNPRRTTLFATRSEALEARLTVSGDARIQEVAGEEGQRVLDQFNDRAPFIRELAWLATDMAKRRGFVRTILGRTLRFGTKPDGSYEWTHKALNRIIQGSGADQMKAAMVAVDEQMPEVILQLQVHDELTASLTDVKQGKDIAEIMMNIIPNTKVPFRVDVEIGPSWGEAELVK